MVDRLWIQGCW